MEVHKLFPEIKVTGQACPMWVPLVEYNEAQAPGADYFVKKYIDELLAKDNQIDTIVEYNEAQAPGADYFVKKYIDELLAKDNQIDTIILGCTHYPLLLPKIKQYVPEGIHIVSQGELVARSLQLPQTSSRNGCAMHAWRNLYLLYYGSRREICRLCLDFPQ